jgi:hypothetical protein
VARGGRGEILPEVLFEYRRRQGSRSSVADDDNIYMEMLRARFHKYESYYREHLIDLLAEKDARAQSHLTAERPELGWRVTEQRAKVSQLRRTLASRGRR